MSGREASDTALAWLLGSDEPAIRGMTRRDLLGQPADDDLARVLEGPIVRALLSGQKRDGGFGGHPYRKWTGAHWRLVSLVELEAPGAPRVMAVAECVLRWFSTPEAVAPPPRLGGLYRAHGSIEGNGLAVSSRLGLAGDPRVQRLAESLIEWQWPDGGWNCSERASGRRSSFHESLAAMWGLHEYALATGNADAAQAALRTAELFLEHRLFRTHGTGGPINTQWVQPRYPPYWHYDILQALHLLRRMGLVADPRASDAIDIVEERRRPDGRWAASGYWWMQPGSGKPNTEVADWGRGQPNPMLTLNALRVLKAAGRWEVEAAA
jgi:hypothetical protein